MGQNARIASIFDPSELSGTPVLKRSNISEIYNHYGRSMECQWFAGVPPKFGV